MILIPEQGAPPERSVQYPVRGRRLLHLALRDARERQPALAAALASLAEDYDELDWNHCSHLEQRFIDKVREFRPTVIWMQLQRRTEISALTIEKIKCITPDVKVVNWDGDQHHEPHDAERHWFVELGRACDASLVVNTKHPVEYASLGVKNPGYLQIGVDGQIYTEMPPGKHVHDVLFLGSHYRTHDARNNLVRDLKDEYGRRFGVYGYGWRFSDGFLFQHQEAPAYNAAKCAISMSIRNDLPRYTSDRLFRAMSSGAVTLVEDFPDYKALGLRHDENCIVWRGRAGLFAAVERALAMSEPERTAIRAAARSVARRRFTWSARMPELNWILEQICA